jgi:hypothetical protein
MLWSRLGSNQRPPACEAGALPLSYETGAKRRMTSKVSTSGRLSRTRCVGRRISARATLRKICAGPLGSTIVVLRTGRRSRSLRADVAQLVAHHLAKVRVAGSNPVIRSRVKGGIKPPRWSGRVVRQRPAKPCTRVRFPSPPPILRPARLAQRESASLTRKRSLVQSQYRAPQFMQFRDGF